MRNKKRLTKILTLTLTTAVLSTGIFNAIPADVFAASTGTVNVSALNLRSGASTGTAVLGVLRKGTSLEILETSGKWCKVSVSVNGSLKTGYVYSDYIIQGSGETQSASGQGVVNTDVLNVRSGPSTGYSRLGSIYRGTGVEIVGTSGEWYQVKVTLNGKQTTAYVHSLYITKTSASSSAGNQTSGSSSQTQSGTAQTGDFSGTGKVDTYALNVRSGASTGTSVIGCLVRNTKITITGKSGDWYKISYNGRTGYVCGRYVKVIQETVTENPSSGGNSSDNQSTAPSVDTAPFTRGKVNTDALNVRNAPSMGAKVLGLIYRNTVVTVTGKSGDWYAVTVTLYGKETNAYVHKDYITELKEGDEGISASSDDEYLLACIVYCEAGNQIYEGQLAVANVVLNRVNSPKFPNTIREVIYQSGQFSPVASGSLDRALANGPTESCIRAAKDALAGNNNVEGYYFFNTTVNTSKVNGYLVIDDHIYYY